MKNIIYIFYLYNTEIGYTVTHVTPIAVFTLQINYLIGVTYVF